MSVFSQEVSPSLETLENSCRRIKEIIKTEKFLQRIKNNIPGVFNMEAIVIFNGSANIY